MNIDTRLTEIYDKVTQKAEAECIRLGDKIPYIPKEGVYQEDMGTTDIAWWTNGFWPGMLWQLYHATKNNLYREAAEGVENRLDLALEQFEELHHDVGFMWLGSSVSDWRLTGNPISKRRGLHAATLLAGRFNIRGSYIRSWNDDKVGWVIVDSLMNLGILYWASEVTGDPRFRFIAEAHADTVLKNIVNTDYSCAHIAVLNPENGNLETTLGGQGYQQGSAWSRGQSWALYGFILSYVHTKKESYLEVARNIGRYFISEVEKTGYVPVIDFKAPLEPKRDDTTAALCAVCGMLELAKQTQGTEAQYWQENAEKILLASCDKWADYNPCTDGILGGGTVAYHNPEYQQVPIIYGDYFLIEALVRLEGKDFLLW
ncbi:glycoside hydrolase family 88 protein [uncultured Sphaerochaeta sp.]|uniref:glycoside hydrolase family 88 protein n=1 Tax=uncultured Sphaerochaeta sp. TaxID=886478 RepID=UPI002A0A862C|nr:glycoside hydrolase family 88 protein [uncultured Sphaerochaeta sp.]